jgi:hypothetical protein
MLQVYRNLTKGERLQDIETLYSIIVAGREDFPDFEMTERIALTAFCFFAWPGKSPRYSADIVPFRRRYIGVARSGRMQENFRSRLTEALLNAESIEDLRFDEVSDIFRVDEGPDWLEDAYKKLLPGGSTVVTR